jgi:hypothetical protein
VHATIRAVQRLLIVLAVAATGVAGCGGGGSGAGSNKPGYGAAPATTATQPTTTAAAPTTTAQSPGALQGEATSQAQGDIPDNQVFLTFRNAAAGYSMKYPEGWAQQGEGKQVTFRDKNNIVRVVVAKGSEPTPATIKNDLEGARVKSGPDTVTIGGAPAFKVVYTTQSAPNDVTGKRVTLVVDRYYFSHAGNVAIVDLGTPEGVDNVDAYRLMSESFRWG